MVGGEFAIDRSAPVLAVHQADLPAAPEAVWDVLTAIDEWPRWNPDVKQATLRGPVAAGTSFEWKAGPGTIRSVFRVVDRPRVLGWTGKTLGIRAAHVYTLDQRPEGTRITTEESWDGLPARAFRRSFGKMLDRSLRAGLSALEAEVGRRTGRS